MIELLLMLHSIKTLILKNRCKEIFHTSIKMLSKMLRGSRKKSKIRATKTNSPRQEQSWMELRLQRTTKLSRNTLSSPTDKL